MWSCQIFAEARKLGHDVVTPATATSKPFTDVSRQLIPASQRHRHAVVTSPSRRVYQSWYVTPCPVVLAESARLPSARSLGAVPRPRAVIRSLGAPAARRTPHRSSRFAAHAGRRSPRVASSRFAAHAGRRRVVPVAAVRRTRSFFRVISLRRASQLSPLHMQREAGCYAAPLATA